MRVSRPESLGRAFFIYSIYLEFVMWYAHSAKEALREALSFPAFSAGGTSARESARTDCGRGAKADAPLAEYRQATEGEPRVCVVHSILCTGRGGSSMALELQCMQAVFFSQEADAAGTQEISIYFGKMALQPLLCGHVRGLQDVNAR